MINKGRTSPYPTDLRTTGPSGDVTTTWQLESFAWHGESSLNNNQALINIYETGRINLSHNAVQLAGFDIEDKFMVGINKHFAAIRKDAAGIAAKRHKNQKSQSMFFKSKEAAKKMKELGWELPCKLSCQLDEKNNMLVVKNPAAEMIRCKKSS